MVEPPRGLIARDHETKARAVAEAVRPRARERGAELYRCAASDTLARLVRVAAAPPLPCVVQRGGDRLLGPAVCGGVAVPYRLAASALAQHRGVVVEIEYRADRVRGPRRIS